MTFGSLKILFIDLPILSSPCKISSKFLSIKPVLNPFKNKSESSLNFDMILSKNGILKSGIDWLKSIILETGEE